MSARDIFEELTAGGWTAVQKWIVEERAESLHLEFKSRDEQAAPADKLTAHDEDDIARTLSGFANVEGGVLVIGLRTFDRHSKRDPDTLDSNLARQKDAYLVDAEAFERAVRHRVRALTDPPVGVRDVLAILDPDDSARGVVAILVPDSDAKPHRTIRGLSANRAERYYERSHVITDVMSHSMLAALFSSRPPPTLRLIVSWLDTPLDPAVAGALRIGLANQGRGTAENAIVSFERKLLESDQAIRPGRVTGMQTAAGTTIWNVTPEQQGFMHPGFEAELCTAGIEATYKMALRTVRMVATIYASNMQPVQIDEVVTFANDGDAVVLPSAPSQTPGR